MRPRSPVSAVRSGRWRRLDPGRPGRLGRLAAGSAALDTITTAHVILSPAYWEGNVVFAAIADHSPWLAVLAFAAFAGTLALCACLSLGWVSTVVATVTVASMGVGGVNNTVLFLTGTSLYTYVGLEHAFVIFYATPATGTLLGVALLARDRTRV